MTSKKSKKRITIRKKAAPVARPKPAVLPMAVGLLDEQWLTVTEIARALRVSPDIVRSMFRGKPGVMRMSSGPKAHLRIPRTLFLAVVQEHGYVPPAKESA